MAHDRTWRKSSYSGGQGECVEVAGDLPHVAVRDSKDPAGPKLIFTSAEWRSFVASIRAGRHDMA